MRAIIRASLSDPHTSVVNGEFLCMYYRGDDGAGGTSVHLVLRVPKSRSHATSLDTRIQDCYVSFSVCYRQHSHIHVYRDGIAFAGYVVEESARGSAAPQKQEGCRRESDGARAVS